MGQIKVHYHVGGIEGLCVIEPTVHGDERGYFTESYNAEDMKSAGLDITFVQDNESRSAKGVLRGLHFQKQHPQTKLVRVVYGTVYDVAVDLRAGSPTRGKYHAEILSEENHKQLLIPRGFAHGFLTLSDEAVVLYKCDEFYHAEDESGIVWSDPEIGVEWPQVVTTDEGYTVDGAPLRLSKKDQKWGALSDVFPMNHTK